MGEAKEMHYFDAHLHLQDDRIFKRVPEILEEAKDLGTQFFACNGCCEEDWEKVQQLAADHPDKIIPNFGLHPWWVGKQSDNWLASLESFLDRHPAAGLGECGLDRCKRASHIDFDDQCRVFEQQIQLAKRMKRPVSVHCVQAFGKLEEILAKEGPFPDGVLLHSWGGKAAQVKSLSKLQGVYFSISGHTLSGSQKKLKQMLKEIPLDRLLLETDAPDGKPNLDDTIQMEPSKDSSEVSDQQSLNHPGNIRLILHFIAKETGTEAEVLAKAAYQNACRIFKRAEE